MLLVIVLFVIFLFVLIEVFGLGGSKSRLLSIIPFLLLWVTFSFNRYNNDYLDYSRLFVEYDLTGNFEFGYAYLVLFFYYFGFDHNAIIFLTGSLLLYVFFRKTKGVRYTSLVVFLYCLYPLYFDLNQIRNTIMYLLVFLSLSSIEYRQPVRHYIIIFLSFTIQKFSLVYLPFYTLCRASRKQFILAMFFGLVLVSLFSQFIISGLAWLYPSKMGSYLLREPGFGVLIVFSYVFLDIFTIWWVDKKTRNRMSFLERNRVEIMYRFIWLTILMLPFTFYFLEVKRMQRNAVLVKYIYCASLMPHMSFGDKMATILLLLVSTFLPFLVVLYNNELDDFNDLDENFVAYLFGSIW